MLTHLMTLYIASQSSLQNAKMHHRTGQPQWVNYNVHSGQAQHFNIALWFAGIFFLNQDS